MEIHRRSLITGLIAFVAAPAIVRATSIMSIKPMYTKVIRYELDYSDMDPRWAQFSDKFNWNPQVVDNDWKTIARIINIDVYDKANIV